MGDSGCPLSVLLDLTSVSIVSYEMCCSSSNIATNRIMRTFVHSNEGCQFLFDSRMHARIRLFVNRHLSLIFKRDSPNEAFSDN